MPDDFLNTFWEMKADQREEASMGRLPMSGETVRPSPMVSAVADCILIDDLSVRAELS